MKYSRSTTVIFGLAFVVFGFRLYDSFPTLSPAAEEGLMYGLVLGIVVSFFYSFMAGLSHWSSRIKVDTATEDAKKEAGAVLNDNPIDTAARVALLLVVVPILTAILLTLQS